MATEPKRLWQQSRANERKTSITWSDRDRTMTARRRNSRSIRPPITFEDARVRTRSLLDWTKEYFQQPGTSKLIKMRRLLCRGARAWELVCEGDEEDAPTPLEYAVRHLDDLRRPASKTQLLDLFLQYDGTLFGEHYADPTLANMCAGSLGVEDATVQLLETNQLPVERAERFISDETQSAELRAVLQIYLSWRPVWTTVLTTSSGRKRTRSPSSDEIVHYPVGRPRKRVCLAEAFQHESVKAFDEVVRYETMTNRSGDEPTLAVLAHHAISKCAVSKLRSLLQTGKLHPDNIRGQRRLHTRGESRGMYRALETGSISIVRLLKEYNATVPDDAIPHLLQHWMTWMYKGDDRPANLPDPFPEHILDTGQWASQRGNRLCTSREQRDMRFLETVQPELRRVPYGDGSMTFAAWLAARDGNASILRYALAQAPEQHYQRFNDLDVLDLVVGHEESNPVLYHRLVRVWCVAARKTHPLSAPLGTNVTRMQLAVAHNNRAAIRFLYHQGVPPLGDVPPPARSSEMPMDIEMELTAYQWTRRNNHALHRIRTQLVPTARPNRYGPGKEWVSTTELCLQKASTILTWLPMESQVQFLRLLQAPVRRIDKDWNDAAVAAVTGLQPLPALLLYALEKDPIQYRAYFTYTDKTYSLASFVKNELHDDDDLRDTMERILVGTHECCAAAIHDAVWNGATRMQLVGGDTAWAQLLHKHGALMEPPLDIADTMASTATDPTLYPPEQPVHEPPRAVAEEEEEDEEEEEEENDTA